MKTKYFQIWTLGILYSSFTIRFIKNEKLSVYPDVPGLEQSPFYTVQVRRGKDLNVLYLNNV